MSKQTEYTWDSYVEEAQIEPFRLRISADETVEVIHHVFDQFRQHLV